MVIVVVRDEHDVDRRQIGQRDRRGMEAPRSDGQRRDAFGEHRVEQQAQAVELDVDAGVPIQNARKPLEAGASAALSTASTGSGTSGSRSSLPENWRTM